MKVLLYMVRDTVPVSFTADILQLIWLLAEIQPLCWYGDFFWGKKRIDAF